MKVRGTIFDSESERELHKSIESKWSSKVAIIPQVPLCKILDLSSEDINSFHKQYFPSIPRSYFVSAHIDYTVCDLKGRPLLSIEFDGMYGGYSSGATYNCDFPWNPERELKLNYKLRLATLAGYPLLVISYKENEPISAGEALTILDGVIGSCIASLQLRGQVEQRLKEMVVPTDEEELDEYFQNLISDTELELELEWDPIARLAAEYHMKCVEKGIGGYSFQWIFPHELPESDLSRPDGVRRRIDALKNQTEVGCKVWMKHPYGEIEEKVLLRNFDAVHIEPLGIAENIAKFRAFKRALQA